jgi:diguanylate cyclase (GGDEF)-like protein
VSYSIVKKKNVLFASCSLLIIDDEPSVGIALKRVLKAICGEIYVVLDVHEALNYLENEHIDIVICDIHLQNASGSDLLLLIAKQFPWIIRLAISADCKFSEMVDVINGGHVAYFFSKPWDNEQLKMVVTNLLVSKKISTEKAELERHLQSRNTDLEKLANTDGLTGLANRRAFDERLQHELNRAARKENSLALLMCDIDFFKPYNDLLGHVAGDECLKKVAHVIRSAFQRAGDFPARYGGEEFAVILPDMSVTQNTKQIGEKLRQKMLDIAIPHPRSSIHEVVTVSIGLATKKVLAGDKPTDIIMLADKALYQAKQNDRNCISLIDK